MRIKLEKVKNMNVCPKCQREMMVVDYSDRYSKLTLHKYFWGKAFCMPCNYERFV
jgi:hypothetical protein